MYKYMHGWTGHLKEIAAWETLIKRKKPGALGVWVISIPNNCRKLKGKKDDVKRMMEQKDRVMDLVVKG